ncbi:hypothetical protein ABKV19_021445 [Rosa sericea]
MNPSDLVDLHYREKFGVSFIKFVKSSIAELLCRLKKGKGFEIDWVELPIVLMLATDLDLVEVSMNFSHDMDHEYEKICRRMNPPRVVVDNEACKNAMVIRVWSPSLILLCGFFALLSFLCFSVELLFLSEFVFTYKFFVLS